MRSTGIIRRIDDLGRVSIPKEVRRMMRIREGDALECYTTCEGEVVFKKYSFMECVTDLASQLCESMSVNFGLTIAITDQDSILAVSGEAATKHDLLGKRINNQIEQIISGRQVYQCDNGDTIFIDDSRKYCVVMITPIISVGELMGSVLIVGNNIKSDGDIEYKVSKTIANILGKQMDI